MLVGRGGARARAARGDPGRPRHAARARAPREAGRRARRDDRGGRAILALGTGDRASLPEHERYGIPVPARRRSARAARGDRRGAPRPVRRATPGRAARTCRRSTGPLLPPGSPEIWVGGLSDAGARRRGARRRRVERLGRRRRGVRGQGRAAARARGRPGGRAHLGRHRARGRGPPPISIGCSPRAPRRACRSTASGRARRRSCERSSRPWTRPARRGSSCCPPGRPTVSTSSRPRWSRERRRDEQRRAQEGEARRATPGARGTRRACPPSERDRRGRDAWPSASSRCRRSSVPPP